MENSIVVFGQNLMKHAIVLLCLLVPALLCLCLLSLSGTSKQAQAHKQSTDTQPKRFEPAAQCAVTAPLRVMYTATVPKPFVQK